MNIVFSERLSWFCWVVWNVKCCVFCVVEYDGDWRESGNSACNIGSTEFRFFLPYSAHQSKVLGVAFAALQVAYFCLKMADFFPQLVKGNKRERERERERDSGSDLNQCLKNGMNMFCAVSTGYSPLIKKIFSPFQSGGGGGGGGIWTIFLKKCSNMVKTALLSELMWMALLSELDLGSG